MLWKQVLVLCVTAAVLAVGSFEALVPMPAAGLLLIAWAAFGLWQGMLASLAMAVPAVVLLWPGLDAAQRLNALPAVLVGAGLVWVGLMLHGLHLRREHGLLDRRIDVARGLYQQRVLHRQIARYPRLLELLGNLFAAQEKGQLAKEICDEVRALVPDLLLVRLSISLDDDTVYRFDRGAHPADHERFETYVLNTQRLHVRRGEGDVAVYVPLRGDRRRPGHEREHRAALTVIFTPQGLEDALLIDALEALGRLAGLSLASVRLLEQARSLALYDDLTGLFGQHEFKRRLQEQIARARRRQEDCGVIMCDMDHLKVFNDTWGHPAGDQALRSIGTLIINMLPDRGSACRYGGEEFAILLGADTAVDVFATQLCAAIRSLSLDRQARVTASLGWARLRDADDAESLLARADRACYQAKHAGRDQVCGEEA